MYLQKLSVNNFKNYTEAELSFSEKLNCFIGGNGEGKTNLLDAIYYLSFCKSYFNPVDSQNILHEAPFFAIHGVYYTTKNEKSKTVSCILKRNQRKQFKLNKKEYERLADHIGMFPLVMVSPYDRDLINSGSELRRKFVDSVISQFDKVYLDHLMNYNRVLSQRNALLKRFAETRSFDYSALEIWDEQLTNLGQVIFNIRKEFLEKFAEIFQYYFEFISGGKEKVSITYSSQLEDGNLKDLLFASQDRDRALRYTTAGTHKDDLVFLINGYPVKKFGSQGQQKSFVIAIRLAQFEYTKNIKGYKPILLLDDIFDKLDNSRVEQIIKLVSNNSFGQVFITDTQRERIEHIFNTVDIEHKIFEIEAGSASDL